MTRRKGYCSFVLRRWRTATALSVSPSVDGHRQKRCGLHSTNYAHTSALHGVKGKERVLTYMFSIPH